MFRRQFIQLLTFAGASSLATVADLGDNNYQTVTYRVQGFTCITCAVGLDTMLQRQRGIVRSQSSYPDATATVVFDPHLVKESDLQAYIAEMGFTVTP